MERFHIYKIGYNKSVDYGGGYSWEDVLDTVKGYRIRDWFGERWLGFTRKGSQWTIWVERER
jgi:hypothetical protein